MQIDRWNALGVVEQYASEPGFHARWRALMRACALLLLPGLRPAAREVAQAWMEAADAYERGELSEAELSEARVRAWRVHDIAPQSERDAMRAVMHRLWPAPPTADEWGLEAESFIEFCDDAGLPRERWGPLVREHFPEPGAGDAGGPSEPSRPAV